MFWSQGGFHLDFKGTTQGAPEREMHEAVRAKPKVEQKPQEVGDAKNVEFMMKKNNCRQQIEPAQERRNVGCDRKCHRGGAT